MIPKLLVRLHEAPEGVKEPVAFVTHQQIWPALTPLLDLLGTSLEAVLADSLAFHGDGVSFVSLEPISGVEPVMYGGGELATDGLPIAAIWAWPVTIPIVSLA